MKIIPVKGLPERHICSYKRMGSFCEEFLAMNIKYAKIEVEDSYSSAYAAFHSLRGITTRRNDPCYPTMVNGELYLVRTDMED
jgi:hypothetical protein